MNESNDPTREKTSKQNYVWILIVIGAIGVLFIVALNNRYRTEVVQDCRSQLSGNQGCVKVLDKWTGKFFTSNDIDRT